MVVVVVVVVVNSSGRSSSSSSASNYNISGSCGTSQDTVGISACSLCRLSYIFLRSNY